MHKQIYVNLPVDDLPKSIAFFESIGLDYVSCSPFRVPIARLAAAQAAIKRREKAKR